MLYRFVLAFLLATLLAGCAPGVYTVSASAYGANVTLTWDTREKSSAPEGAVKGEAEHAENVR